MFVFSVNNEDSFYTAQCTLFGYFKFMFIAHANFR